MVDRYYASIRIGGPIPPDLLGQLANVIEGEGVLDRNYDDVVFDSPQELGKHIEDGRLFFHDWQAVYGMFDMLEPFLQEHGIPYDRHSGAHHELDAEKVYYRPGMDEPVVRHCDSETGNCEYVKRDDVKALLEMESAEEIKERLREILGNEVSPLPEIASRELLPERQP